MISFYVSILLVTLLIIMFSRIDKLDKKVSALEKKQKMMHDHNFDTEIASDGTRRDAKKSNGEKTAVDKKSEAQLSGREASVSPTSTRDPMRLFSDWLKEDWLMKLGALLLLIGFGWLTTYAFVVGWIGPAGRIILGVSVGALVMVFGLFRINKYINQGSVFLVLGSSIMLVTLYAARSVYDYLTPLSALYIMLLIVSVVACVGVIRRNKILTVISLVLAGVAPLLTSPSSYFTSSVWLYSYLLIVVLGTIWVVVLANTPELTLAALVIVSLYSLPSLVDPNSPEQLSLMLFAYGFAILLFFANVWSLTRSRDRDLLTDIFVAGGVGLFVLLWTLTSADGSGRILLLLVWLAIYMVVSFSLFKVLDKRTAFYIYSAVAVAYMVAITALELNGATLALTLTIESTAISIAVFKLLGKLRVAMNYLVLLSVPVILSLFSIFSDSWEISAINKDFFVLLLLGVSLLGLGRYYLSYANDTEDKVIKNIITFLFYLGSAYIYILIWLSLHALLESDALAVMLSLVIYTTIGLVTYFYGSFSGKTSLQVYGGVLIGTVVVRLLVVDVWSMDSGSRIMTFLVIGTILLSTAFISKKSLFQGDRNRTLR